MAGQDSCLYILRAASKNPTVIEPPLQWGYFFVAGGALVFSFLNADRNSQWRFSP